MTCVPVRVEASILTMAWEATPDSCPLPPPLVLSPCSPVGVLPVPHTQGASPRRSGGDPICFRSLPKGHPCSRTCLKLPTSTNPALPCPARPSTAVSPLPCLLLSPAPARAWSHSEASGTSSVCPREPVSTWLAWFYLIPSILNSAGTWEALDHYQCNNGLLCGSHISCSACVLPGGIPGSAGTVQ